MSEPNEQLIQTPGVFGENGNFLLERELGRGGMGGVYMGRDKMLDRPVAVKVMLREYGDDPEFVEKFKREAQAAARLIHPNIAQIYSYGISDGMPYIAMELVAGGSLDSLMRHSPGTMEVPRVMKICEQVAQALRCAADQGLVHGDVKPENVLLDANGNAKLVDFGLAGMQKDTDEIWGTPYYISPEKVQRQPVDYRADMYSLGGTLYHALTGVAPFEGDDANAVVRKRFEGMPKKPSEIRPGLSPEIDALVMTMLAFNRDERFPSFEALVEEFKKVMTVGLGVTQTMKTLSRPGEAGASGGGTMKRLTVKRRGATIKRKAPTAAEGDKVADDIPDLPPPEEDEEESGGIAGKVIGVILGVILVVGGVGGFLWWYVNHDKSARSSELAGQVSTGIASARKAISQTRDVVGKYADEYEKGAQAAVEECAKVTEKMKALLPDFADQLKPAESAELLAARELANPPAEKPAEAKEGAKTAETAKAPDVQPQAAPQPAAVAKFRAPNEDEADPASPAYKEYQEEKAAFEAAQRAKAGGASESSAPAPAAAADAAPAREAPSVVNDVRELWDRAYSCQASAIKIRLGIAAVIVACDQALATEGDSEETLRTLEKASNDIRDQYAGVQTARDKDAKFSHAENIKKGVGYIRDRGRKLLSTTGRELEQARIERENTERRAREEAERAQREKEAAEARANLIEQEKADAKAQFESVGNLLRALAWDAAIRQLEFFKADLKTADGKLATDDELRKVKAMKSVNDIFVRNLKGYAFKKAGLAKLGCTVKSVDESELQLVKRDRKPMKLTWVKLYREYQGNLNELINTFVVDGRKNGNPKLNLREWADAMCGAALSMTIICSDNPGAVSRGQELAKEVFEKYPDYQKYVRTMFPDVDFGEGGSDE